MKKLLPAIFTVLILLIAVSARCQTYGSVSTSTNYLYWTGNTNAPAYSTSTGQPLTNIFTVTPGSVYIQLTNVVSTNETFTGSVYVQIPWNLLTNFPGAYSNMLFIGSVTQTFTNGLPANSVWATNTTPTPGTFATPVIFQASNGTWTNGIYAK